MRRIVAISIASSLCGGCEQILGIEQPSSGSGSNGLQTCAPGPAPTFGAAIDYGGFNGGATVEGFAVGKVIDGIRPDLIVTTGVDIFVHPAMGNGAFGASQSLVNGIAVQADQVLVVDLDQDQKDDVVSWIVGTGTVDVRYNADSFVSPTTFAIAAGNEIGNLLPGHSTPGGPAYLVVEADGPSAGSTSVITVHHQTARQFDNGTVVVPSGFLLAVRDLDGDGSDDIVYLDTSRVVNVIYGDSSGGFSPASVVGTGSTNFAIGHFAANAQRLDMILLEEVGKTGEARLYAQNQPRTFLPSAAPVFQMPLGNGSSMFAVDLNLDGRDDVLNLSGLAVQCPMPSPLGVFAQDLTPIGHPPVQQLAAVDLSGDGKPDLLEFNSSGPVKISIHQ